jgi:fructokinase|tara:strand:- start:208 stop:1062 length:855 start_codon:yes stop_codon:yes gene_type:complete
MIGGVEFGGTKCILAVGNSPLEILDSCIIQTSDPVSTFEKIHNFFSSHSLDSLGVGSFGPIILDRKSVDYGMIYSESKKGWKGINIYQMFKDKLKLELVIDTDVNVAGLGEYHYGAGKNINNLVYLTIGTGVGGGLLVNGKIRHGNFHLEMGHIPLPNPKSFDSVCRVHDNCWDGLASGPALELRYGIPASEMVESHAGWDEEAKLIALGVISIIANHSPDKIIIGGGVMQQKHLYSKIKNYVISYWNDCTPIGNIDDLIVEPELGNNSGIIGSLLLGTQVPLV